MGTSLKMGPVMGPSVEAQVYSQATQDRLRAGSGQLSRAQDCTATAQEKGPPFCRALSPEWTLLDAENITSVELSDTTCSWGSATPVICVARLKLQLRPHCRFLQH